MGGMESDEEDGNEGDVISNKGEFERRKKMRALNFGGEMETLGGPKKKNRKEKNTRMC